MRCPDVAMARSNPLLIFPVPSAPVPRCTGPTSNAYHLNPIRSCSSQGTITNTVLGSNSRRMTHSTNFKCTVAERMAQVRPQKASVYQLQKQQHDPTSIHVGPIDSTSRSSGHPWTSSDLSSSSKRASCGSRGWACVPRLPAAPCHDACNTGEYAVFCSS